MSPQTAGAGTQRSSAGAGVSGARKSAGVSGAGKSAAENGTAQAADTPRLHADGPQQIGVIWAHSRDGLLGAKGDMLWRVPADFAHFRACTLGGAVIMGRTTWESLRGALPQRHCIVLSRSTQADPAAGDWVSSLDEALVCAQRWLSCEAPADPRSPELTWMPRLWIIGGGTVYRQALERHNEQQRTGGQPFLHTAVLSTIDIEASRVAQERGLPADSCVRAPLDLMTDTWTQDLTRSDPLTQWRPVSGDAAWRYDVWTAAQNS